jgi:hypothetical protein
MCHALDFANSINTQITEAKEYYNKLKIKEKVFNDVQQDILHKIEGLDKFSLYTGWKFCMALSKLRKARRKTKNELKTMELLVKQLEGFSIQESKIDRQANRLDRLNFENNYHRRQLDMTGDILEEIDSIVDNVLYNENLTRSNANKTENNIKKTYVYKMTDKLPNSKGSTIKVEFKSDKQLEHLINVVANAYTNYKVCEQDLYVELIDRK